MVAIAGHHRLRYDVERLVDRAYQGLERFPGLVDRQSVVPEATAFILERLAKSLADEGLARDTVDAILPTSRDFLDLRARATALHAFRSGASWEDLVTVFTRPANLARQLPPDEAAEASVRPGGGVSPALFQAEAESALFAA
jgi:glycyl-tRNA synthetase beta subunit